MIQYADRVIQVPFRVASPIGDVFLSFREAVIADGFIFISERLRIIRICRVFAADYEISAAVGFISGAYAGIDIQQLSVCYFWSYDVDAQNQLRLIVRQLFDIR